jgi:hypothetical protein
MVVTDDGTFRDFRFPKSFVPQHAGEQVVQGDLIHPDWTVETIARDTIHVDFWSVKPESVSAFLMFITGPKVLNIQQRAHAQSLGYTLSQYGLTRPDGTLVRVDSEEDIYWWLGLDWISPESRQAYAKAEPDREEPEHVFSMPSDSDPSKNYKVTIKGLSQTCVDAKTGEPCMAYKYSRSAPATCKHIERARAKLAEQESS